MRRRELLELHAICMGNVQGVGFRAAVKSFADRLHILGFVRNLPDATVEICAQGEKIILEEFLAQLRLAFQRNLKRVEANYRAESEKFSSFSILR